MHNVETKEFVFPNGTNCNQWTWTRVEEINKCGDKIILDGFSSAGLYVTGYANDADNAIGLAFARKS